MAPGGAISGTARGRDGRPLTDGCEIVTSRRTGRYTEDIDFDGTAGYQADGLAPGRYSVEFYDCGGDANYAIQWYDRRASPGSASSVLVTAARVTRSVDAVLTPGGRISGRLTAKSTGHPVRDFCVMASTAPGTYFGFGETGRDGNYVVPGLNTGTYHLAVSNCGTAASTLASGRLARTVHVTEPRTVSGVNATLPAGGSISGQVRAGAPAATPRGDVCVQARPVTGAAAQYASTSPGGHYVLPNLPPGRYRVFFDSGIACDASQDGLLSQWYDDAATKARATAVTVTAGQDTPGIDATLRADGGISGTVTAAGAPLTGACVRAVPRAAGRSASFTATAGGRYLLTALAPGAYTVRFSSGCGAAGYAAQWWDGKGSAGRATVINVQAGAVRAGIDAALAH